MENTYTILFNVLALMLGILMHFAKKKWKGQTTGDVVAYFKTHFVDTVKVIISAVVVFGLAYQTETLNFLSAFTAGYACDSLFNKAMGDIEQQVKQGKVEKKEAR